METNRRPFAPRTPPSRYHSPPSDGDAGGPAEGLDVVDHRRLAVEPGDGGEGGLVPRLPSAVFHRLQQRRLLAADVAAGADEDLEGEREARAQDVVAADPRAVGGLDGLLDDLDLLLVLVADVDPASSRAGDEPGEDHPLDEEVGGPADQLAVLEGARLALVGVADDELLEVGLRADAGPLQVGGEPGAAHPPEVGDLQGVDHLVAAMLEREPALDVGHQEPHGLVAGLAVVDVDPPAQGGAVGPLLVDRLVAQGRPDSRAGLRGGDPPETGVVDRQGGRAVALAQAGDAGDLDLLAADLGREPPNGLFQGRGAVEVAGHVAADGDLDLRPFAEPVVREEAGDLVDPAERRPGRGGQLAKLALREPAASMLDLAQFLDDHRSIRSVTVGPATTGIDRAGRCPGMKPVRS